MLLEQGFELARHLPDNRDLVRQAAIERAARVLRDAKVVDIVLLGEFQPYTSKLQAGVTVIWRRGEINCYNLRTRLREEELEFANQLGQTQYRTRGRFGTLEYLDTDRNVWTTCENGEHQVYFDLLKQQAK